MIAQPLYPFEERPVIVERAPGLTTIERIAHRLYHLTNKPERAALAAWSMIVAENAQCSRTKPTVRVYGAVLRIFDQHSAFSANEIAADYRKLIADYHQCGMSAVDVHDEVARIIARWVG